MKQIDEIPTGFWKKEWNFTRTRIVLMVWEGAICRQEKGGGCGWRSRRRSRMGREGELYLRVLTNSYISVGYGMRHVHILRPQRCPKKTEFYFGNKKSRIFIFYLNIIDVFFNFYKSCFYPQKNIKLFLQLCII